MASLDIFKSDAFGVVELTAALNKVPYTPNFLGNLGIFEPKPIRTLAVAIEKRDNVLALVPTSQRGAPLGQRTNEKRDIRDFRTVRVAKGDRLTSDELQSIRAFGSETELMQVQDETMRRMMSIRRDIDLTHENMRLGAIQGIVTDADGSTIRNWFTEWGIAQPSEIDFDLDNASPVSGAVRKLCNQVVRSTARAAKGAWVDGQSQVYGLCGDAFWDDLTAHKEVRETYLNQLAAAELRTGNAFGSFNYGGITFINYRGTDDGTTVAVGTDKVKFFPVGAPSVFQQAMSPGESFDWVNTLGQPFYALTIPDDDRKAFIDIEVYSYPLYICTRPEMLQRGKRT